MKGFDLKDYPRYLTTAFQPYDPLEIAQWTEEVVCQGDARKYTDFYCVGVYGGISTGYTVGCPLRCAFCWVEWSRDFPESSGEFFTPSEVHRLLLSNARHRRIRKLRISGGEPTLGRDHLLHVLDLLKGQDYLFILETNGILLGADEGYVRDLSGYRNLYLRISLKAGTAEGFERRTGARGEFHGFPFRAVEHLLKAGLDFHVAAMSDSRLMPAGERKAMLEKLEDVGYRGYLEEEVCDPYATTLQRLQRAGIRII
ncbi:MAG: radical SAM protein [candidate division NC10 bacterium]|nr:radical SAM protein [candidate division NC10 bacterium]